TNGPASVQSQRSNKVINKPLVGVQRDIEIAFNKYEKSTNKSTKDDVLPYISDNASISSYLSKNSNLQRSIQQNIHPDFLNQQQQYLEREQANKQRTAYSPGGQRLEGAYDPNNGYMSSLGGDGDDHTAVSL
ncbi:unnamed protein product, partial [Rotaria socialis]